MPKATTATLRESYRGLALQRNPLSLEDLQYTLARTPGHGRLSRYVGKLARDKPISNSNRALNHKTHDAREEVEIKPHQGSEPGIAGIRQKVKPVHSANTGDDATGVRKCDSGFSQTLEQILYASRTVVDISHAENVSETSKTVLEPDIVTNEQEPHNTKKSIDQLGSKRLSDIENNHHKVKDPKSIPQEEDLDELDIAILDLGSSKKRSQANFDVVDPPYKKLKRPTRKTKTLEFRVAIPILPEKKARKIEGCLRHQSLDLDELTLVEDRPCLAQGDHLIELHKGPKLKNNIDPVSPTLQISSSSKHRRKTNRCGRKSARNKFSPIDLSDYRFPASVQHPYSQRHNDANFMCSDGFEHDEAKPTGRTFPPRRNMCNKLQRKTLRTLGKLTIVSQTVRYIGPEEILLCNDDKVSIFAPSNKDRRQFNDQDQQSGTMKPTLVVKQMHHLPGQPTINDCQNDDVWASLNDKSQRRHSWSLDPDVYEQLISVRAPTPFSESEASTEEMATTHGSDDEQCQSQEDTDVANSDSDIEPLPSEDESIWSGQ